MSKRSLSCALCVYCCDWESAAGNLIKTIIIRTTCIKDFIRECQGALLNVVINWIQWGNFGFSLNCTNLLHREESEMIFLKYKWRFELIKDESYFIVLPFHNYLWKRRLQVNLCSYCWDDFIKELQLRIFKNTKNPKNMICNRKNNMSIYLRTEQV